MMIRVWVHTYLAATS